MYPGLRALALALSAWLVADGPAALAAQELLPPNGATFAVLSRITSNDKDRKITEVRGAYEVRYRGETGATFLIRGDQPRELETDREQNILYFAGADWYVGYQPYRPAYVAPLRPGSRRVDYYKITYDKTDPKNWSNCASLIEVGARTSYTIEGNEFDGLEVSRINVCSTSSSGLQIETESEIFCPEFNFSCVWSYAIYMGDSPQPNFVEGHLNTKEDFEQLRRKLVFFDKTYEEEIRLTSVRYR